MIITPEITPEITPDNIRALSWKQPYGTLMLPPYDKIETRTWGTNYRGWVLICASKQAYKIPVIHQISGQFQMERIFGIMMERDLFLGHAIGVGKLVDCRRMNPEDEDKCFVQFHNDLFCHVYEQVRAIEPFEYKGSQKWGKVTQEQIEKIKFI